MEVLFIIKMKKYVIVIVIWLLIIFAGFIKISSELPDFIKNKSSVEVTFSMRPFNLKFETSKYVIYINKQAVNNIKKNIVNTFYYLYKTIINEKNSLFKKLFCRDLMQNLYILT